MSIFARSARKRSHFAEGLWGSENLITRGFTGRSHRRELAQKTWRVAVRITHARAQLRMKSPSKIARFRAPCVFDPSLYTEFERITVSNRALALALKDFPPANFPRRTRTRARTCLFLSSFSCRWARESSKSSSWRWRRKSQPRSGSESAEDLCAGLEFIRIYLGARVRGSEWCSSASVCYTVRSAVIGRCDAAVALSRYWRFREFRFSNGIARICLISFFASGIQSYKITGCVKASWIVILYILRIS